MVLLVLLAVLGSIAAFRINHPLTAPALTAASPVTYRVPGTTPALPWSTYGQSAVAIPSLGVAVQSGVENPVPIASLTKMTTALVVLDDHPLPAGANGPIVTITADDAAQFDADNADDQSSVPVSTGEQLSERQLLEAMLLPSANNIAYALAEWDAGSQPAFVAKMNAAAAAVGATATHFVDASGFDPGSVSTAADCLKIAAAGLRIPAFAQIVAMPSAPFPQVGTIRNVIGGVGGNGIVGVKSGFTDRAGGCLVLAADRVVDGVTVQVLVAVLAQPVIQPPPPPPPAPGSPAASTSTTTTSTSTTTTTTPTTVTQSPAAPAGPPTSAPVASPAATLPIAALGMADVFKPAASAALALVAAAESNVGTVTVGRSGGQLGTATTTFGGDQDTVPVVASSATTLLAWPGQSVHSQFHLDRVPSGARQGARAGTAFYWLGTQLQAVPLRLSATLSEPSWWWRVVHG